MPERSIPRRVPRDPERELLATLRCCFGRFATGVAVVSFDGPSGRHGLTVNSLTSVSLRPPLALVSIAKTAKAHDGLLGRPFCVNILGAEQESLARAFAGGEPAEPAWIEGEHAPRLAGVLAHLECTPWAAYDGGDHTLFLGEVVGFDHREGNLLGYVSGRFVTIRDEPAGVEDLI